MKIASRCNLACDYCYMYEHADQTWREQPRVMAKETRSALARRLAEYCDRTGLEEVVIVFHGGEPLLAGASTIAETAAEIEAAVRRTTRVSFSLQTNGVLLDAPALSTLADARIGVSLSLDGPREANDRHRLTVRGRSSFDATMRALDLLREHQSSFTGVISVIDPAVPAVELFRFFDKHRPPQIDFLLPDANHQRPPPGRVDRPSIYVDWLVDAFDVWFDEFAHLPVRTFDQLLRSIAGLPSGTDAYGLGDVSLLTIETDGSYHDLDVLKVTEHGGTATGLGVQSSTIAEAATSTRIEAHRRLLTRAGLSPTCRACPEVEVCGGGAVPHRFDVDGFDHPTIYCDEMLELIGHARRRVAAAVLAEQIRQEGLETDGLVPGYDDADNDAVRTILANWQGAAADELRLAVERLGGAPGSSSLSNIDPNVLPQVATHPAIVLRVRVSRDAARGVTTRSLEGQALEPDEHLELAAAHLADEASGARWGVHRDDAWLRTPFGPPIVFEADEALVDAGRSLVAEAERIIADYSPALRREMTLLSREIQFIRDLDADPDKVVSFSDDVVPGCLYVSLRGSDGLISRFDLADSLIHEHRHQKLYLLQRSTRLIESDRQLVRSPWRADLRPPSGLLHAVFVFVELRRFWIHVGSVETGEIAVRASTVVALIDERLNEAWDTLETVDLTASGKVLVNELRSGAAP